MHMYIPIIQYRRRLGVPRGTLAKGRGFRASHLGPRPRGVHPRPGHLRRPFERDPPAEDCEPTIERVTGPNRQYQGSRSARAVHWLAVGDLFGSN